LARDGAAQQERKENRKSSLAVKRHKLVL
jgi:hypothetical protein